MIEFIKWIFRIIFNADMSQQPMMPPEPGPSPLPSVPGPVLPPVVAHPVTPPIRSITMMTLADIETHFGKFAYQDKADGFIEIAQDWMAANLTVGTFPLIGKARVHIKLFDAYQAIWAKIAKQCPEAIEIEDTKKIGGCFVPRHMLFKKEKPLSRHSWGMAWDMNPTTNGYGVNPKLDGRVVKIWEDAGFVWGGRWNTKDGMHVETSLELARSL